MYKLIVKLIESTVNTLDHKNNAEFQQALVNLLIALREVRKYF